MIQKPSNEIQMDDWYPPAVTCRMAVVWKHNSITYFIYHEETTFLQIEINYEMYQYRGTRTRNKSL